MRPHPDLDALALHALGEPVLDPASLEHVATCSRCSDTVVGLAGTVSTARGPAVHDLDPVPVPAHVWQGISTELGLDPALRPASVGPSRLPGRPAAGAGGPRGAAPTSPTVPAALPLVSPVRRTRAPGLRLLAVAAAGAVVGAAGAAAVLPRLGPDPAAPGPAVLAAADLEAFGAGEGTAVTGSARLAGDAAAERVLEVRLDAVPDTGDGFLEAWLIDGDTGAMVSLGPVPSGTGGDVTAELSVPRGLDVDTYDLVDVSAEPLDGDPTHSGASLVRGTLGT